MVLLLCQHGKGRVYEDDLCMDICCHIYCTFIYGLVRFYFLWNFSLVKFTLIKSKFDYFTFWNCILDGFIDGVGSTKPQKRTKVLYFVNQSVTPYLAFINNRLVYLAIFIITGISFVYQPRLSSIHPHKLVSVALLVLS